MLIPNTHGGHIVAAGGDYAANAVDNGGSVDLRNTNFTTTITGGQTLLFSAWFYSVAASWPTSFPFLCLARDVSNRGCPDIKFNTSNRIEFKIANAAGSNLLSSNISGFSNQTWHHLLISCDFSPATAIYQAYIDDAAASKTGTPVQGAIADPDLAYLFLNSDVYAADFFLEYGGAYLDISVEANRRNFIDASGKPVDLSGYRSPQFLFTGDTSTWEQNDGSGEDLTENGGSLATAPSSPSD